LIACALTVACLAVADSLSRIGGFGSFDRAAALLQYNAPNNFSHRYRVISQGGTNRYCDLSYAFTNRGSSAWKFLRGEIAQVRRDELILDTFNYNADADRVFAGKFVALRNYPAPDAKLADGQTITCFALESGTLQLRDGRGTTLPLYDHGIPFDPSAMAASNALKAAQSNQLRTNATTFTSNPCPTVPIAIAGSEARGLFCCLPLPFHGSSAKFVEHHL
jgi:hypothetical protein